MSGARGKLFVDKETNLGKAESGHQQDVAIIMALHEIVPVPVVSGSVAVARTGSQARVKERVGESGRSKDARGCV